MKLNFTKATLIFTGALLFGNRVFAQTADSTITDKEYVKPFSGNSAFRTWSFGINVGALSTFTILQSNNRLDFTSPNLELGYGGYIKKQILPSFGIQSEFLVGNLQGDKPQPLPNGVVPYNQFNTVIQYASSLSSVFTVANINWHHEKPGMQFYVTAGGGIMGYKPVLTAELGGAKTNFRTAGDGYINEIFIPVGAGFKFNVTRTINIDLGYRINFLNADNLDGYNTGVTNDKYSYTYIGLEFAFGSREKPQLATHNPVASMRTEYLADEQKLQTAIDAQKAQNDQLKKDMEDAKAAFKAATDNLAKLTADSDGDGVPDLYDKCPNTPAGVRVDGSGCPLPVNNNMGNRPPDVKVYVTEEDKKVVTDAVQSLEFNFGKATIRASSFADLDKLAQLLTEKNLNLKLAGYTDDWGSAAGNLKLSKERAEAVKTYLVSKGARAGLIEAVGFGEENPIATNATVQGRQQNRRVEFTLY